MTEAGRHRRWLFSLSILVASCAFGDVAIAQCVSTYLTETPPEVYDNLFVIRLAPDGRATEYTDWWVQRKAPASTGPDA